MAVQEQKALFLIWAKECEFIKYARASFVTQHQSLCNGSIQREIVDPKFFLHAVRKYRKMLPKISIPTAEIVKCLT